MSNNLINKGSFEFIEGVSQSEFEGVYELIADAVHDNILTGTYTGDGNTSEGLYITLAKKPRAVLVYIGKSIYTADNCAVMLMLDNYAGRFADKSVGAITDEGFFVTDIFNNGGWQYGYVAIC